MAPTGLSTRYVTVQSLTSVTNCAWSSPPPILTSEENFLKDYLETCSQLYYLCHRCDLPSWKKAAVIIIFLYIYYLYDLYVSFIFHPINLQVIDNLARDCKKWRQIQIRTTLLVRAWVWSLRNQLSVAGCGHCPSLFSSLCRLVFDRLSMPKV